MYGQPLHCEKVYSSDKDFTYRSNFFDDKIDCQCQKQKEYANNVANSFESTDS